MLEGYPELSVVGEASSAAAAVEQAERTAPMVVVMALRLPEQSVIEASRRIRNHDAAVRVLLLASHRDDAVLLSTVIAGGVDYMLMDLNREALCKAVLQAARGTSVLDRRQVLRAFDGARSGGALRGLGALEDLLLDLVRRGESDREIATRLLLPEQFVRDRLLRAHAALIGARRT